MESVDIADSFAANMGGCLSLHRSSYLAFSTTMRSCKVRGGTETCHLARRAFRLGALAPSPDSDQPRRRCAQTNMTGSAEGSAVLVNQSSSYACHGCLLEADSAAGRDIKVSLNSTLAVRARHAPRGADQLTARCGSPDRVTY